MDPSEHENQNASDSTGKRVAFVIIPFDYERLPDNKRSTIVPICIASVDRHGNAIARVWFEEGVVPIQDQLRGIARYRLGDVHRVSELAETTVHKLWEQHGENAGFLPWHRVLTRAEWEARHMVMGGSPWRKAHTVPLKLSSLERRLYRKRAAGAKKWEETYERDLLVDLVERQIRRENREDFREAFKMLREGYGWDEIAERVHDSNAEALKRRFWRWINRTFRNEPQR
jgi:hypothetical protein